jgi:hypothetical protein
VVQAQALKVVMAKTMTASALAGDVGQATRRRISTEKGRLSALALKKR